MQVRKLVVTALTVGLAGAALVTGPSVAVAVPVQGPDDTGTPRPRTPGTTATCSRTETDQASQRRFRAEAWSASKPCSRTASG